MVNRLSDNQKTLLTEAIYFLKIDELKEIAGMLDVPPKGKKGDILNQIFAVFGIASDDFSVIDVFTLPAQHPSDASPATHIMPQHYTNGKAARALFKDLIGPHFTFTGYGMEWIKACWAADIYPSYEAFAEFWRNETERRKTGAFKSLSTNRRVRFFRQHKGMERPALEQAWSDERAKQVGIVKAIIKNHLAN